MVQYIALIEITKRYIMTKSHPFLELRGKIYYYRKRVPQDLLKFFHKDRLIISLRTSRLNLAIKGVNYWDDKCESVFARLRYGNLSELDIATQTAELVPETKSKRKASLKISDAFDRYEAKRGSRWAPKTKQEYGLSKDICLEFFKDSDVRSISLDKCYEYQAFLTTLPKRGKGQTGIIDGDTVCKHLGRFRAALALAMAGGVISVNPMAVVTQNKSTDKEVPRVPYEHEDIKLIIELIMAQDKDKRPSRYWVPLLAMYSGCRKGELCQLYPDDIIEVDGIKCLRITDARPDQRLKNKAAKRIVPIHRVLIEIGFCEWVDSKDKDVRLFTDLSLARDGYGHSFKWYAPATNKLVPDERKTMHSFRHGVSTMLMELKFHSVWRADLLGHTRPGNLETDATYTHKTKTETLKPMVDAITYGEIDAIILQKV
jgi:integrase